MEHTIMEHAIMEHTICKHFGDCGGCSFQNIPYQQQLRDKEAGIRKLISDCGFQAELKPINHYPEWFYRNKMEFCFTEEPTPQATGSNKLACGLYSKKSHSKVVDLQECLIFSPDAPLIFETIKEFAGRKNYSPYNKYRYKGFLRHLVARETKFTGELMLGIVTTSEEEIDRE